MLPSYRSTISLWLGFGWGWLVKKKKILGFLERLEGQNHHLQFSIQDLGRRKDQEEWNLEIGWILGFLKREQEKEGQIAAGPVMPRLKQSSRDLFTDD
ncbi:hypothetical protein E2562_031073 [Oryza meyeriana var. granulata]|uniref:Uncharacterized protein n=1 Tax=Oryza meyeriana var. granulata TaxID=110450 RepID=A0A6G1E4N4_9ORYZ|nr:hypothetical protein E2562_031073 [Oryza meyeriana var. granulata]